MFWYPGKYELECCYVLSGLVGYVGKKAVQKAMNLQWFARLGLQSLLLELKGKKLMETAVVRRTYARWCGGTAAKAASYPISPGKEERRNPG